jgi:PKD repeat protein
MRHRAPIRSSRILAPAAAFAGVACALLAGLVAAPASGVTNLYAPQRSGTTGNLLSQYIVGGDGSLTEQTPSALGFGAQDMAITPDGRFGYVTRSQGTDAGAIAQFARGNGGRMEPNGVLAADSDPRGILVNPQGTRVYYVLGGPGDLQSRPIAANGTLGAATTVVLGLTAPRFVAMTPSGTSLYVSDASARLGPRVLQFDVDPATGAVSAKAPAAVAWPSAPGATAPAEAGRMTMTPDGRNLYATAATGGSGIAHFAIDASGALSGGSITGVFGDLNGNGVVPVAAGGAFAWAPTISGTPGRIDQYAIGASGALSALSPPAATYVVEASARDAAASPDGRSLYLGQDGNVGEWTIAAGGTLSPRADHASLVGGVQNAGVVLAPSQAPVASFTASPQPAGQPSTFDASTSTDPDGVVARYDWSFGDGASLPDGGPAPSHVYTAAGARTVTLTVTDADGTSTTQLWTGSRMLRNGAPSAQTTRDVTIASAGPGATPAPDKGKSVTIVATSGIVKVKLPGSKVYVDVSTLTEIPLGSRIDARKGNVRITVEVNKTKHITQTVVFHDGIFVVTQTKGAKPFLVATLVGGTFAGCVPKASSSSAVARSAGVAAGGLVASAAKAKKKRSKRTVRRLWGHGKGDFKTVGQRSSATVRGTWWLVEDRCDGTLTRVKEGRVDVRDVRLKKTIKLRAGKRSLYLAKAP